MKTNKEITEMNKANTPRLSFVSSTQKRQTHYHHPYSRTWRVFAWSRHSTFSFIFQFSIGFSVPFLSILFLILRFSVQFSVPRQRNRKLRVVCMCSFNAILPILYTKKKENNKNKIAKSVTKKDGRQTRNARKKKRKNE